MAQWVRADRSSGRFLPWNREPGGASIALEGRRTFRNRLDSARIVDAARRTLLGCRRVADVAVVATICGVGMRVHGPRVLRPEHFFATVRASLGADQCVFHGPRPRERVETTASVGVSPPLAWRRNRLREPPPWTDSHCPSTSRTSWSLLDPIPVGSRWPRNTSNRLPLGSCS